MNLPLTVSVSPLPGTPAPGVSAPAPEPADGFDPLGRCHVELAPEGKTALALASLVKRLAAKCGGRLTLRDRQNVERECRRVGFNEDWTAFVLGRQ